MNIQLIEGEFEPSDALDLISQMIQVKIKYHENKIGNSETEEDIKARETKIIKLQRDLAELRANMNILSNGVKINTTINIE